MTLRRENWKGRGRYFVQRDKKGRIESYVKVKKGVSKGQLARSYQQRKSIRPDTVRRVRSNFIEYVETMPANYMIDMKKYDVRCDMIISRLKKGTYYCGSCHKFTSHILEREL